MQHSYGVGAPARYFFLARITGEDEGGGWRPWARFFPSQGSGLKSNGSIVLCLLVQGRGGEEFKNLAGIDLSYPVVVPGGGREIIGQGERRLVGGWGCNAQMMKLCDVTANSFREGPGGFGCHLILFFYGGQVCFPFLSFHGPMWCDPPISGGVCCCLWVVYLSPNAPFALWWGSPPCPCCLYLRPRVIEDGDETVRTSAMNADTTTTKTSR